MSLRADERGQAIQVGASILLAFVVLSASLYQAQVVPAQNEEVEFNHNQRVQTQLQDVRNAVVSVPGGTSGRSVSVDLGTRYPSRALFVNPGPPGGQLRTVDLGGNLTVEHATSDDEETGDFWTGRLKEYATKGVVYDPNYRVYDEAPTTYYENSVVYDDFGSSRLTESDQRLVDGTTITLVILAGNYQKASTRTASLDLRAVSTSTRTVTVSNDGDPIEISVPTRLSESEWQQLLAEQTGSDGNVVSGSVSVTSGMLSFELNQNEEYTLRMAKVGVGSDVASPNAEYVTLISGDRTVTKGESTTLVVEARDRYNNPVPGASISAGTLDTDSSVRFPDGPTADEDGQVRVQYQAPPSGSSTTNDEVQVTLDRPGSSPFDATEPEDIGLELSVVDSPSAPTASFDFSPSAFDAGESVTFNANAVDPDGSITGYDWTFGDGTNATGQTVQHNYSTDGTYTVELTVTDDTGATTTEKETVTVGSGGSNTDPTADAGPASGGAYAVDEGDSVSVTGDGSSDPDGSIAGYRWRIVTDPTGGASLSNENTEVATFQAPSVSSDTDVTVELNVTDNDGASDTDQATVTVRDTSNSDTTDPSVASATLPGTPIDDQEANDNVERTLTVQFTENMDQTVDPTVRIDRVTGSSATVGNGGWADAQTYEVPVTFSDNDIDERAEVVVSGATDTSGNQMTEQRPLTFEMDTELPMVANGVTVDTAPIDATTQDAVTVTITAPDTVLDAQYEDQVVVFEGPNGVRVTARDRLVAGDGGGSTTVSGVDLSSLADGQISVGVFGRDNVGNTQGAVNTTVRKDTVVPDVTAFDPTVSGDDVDVTFRADESVESGGNVVVEITDANGNVVETIDTGQFSESQAGGEFEYTEDVTENLPDGEYTVTLVTAADAAGNDYTDDGDSPRSTTVTVDTTPPSLSALSVSQTGPTPPLANAPTGNAPLDVTASFTASERLSSFDATVDTPDRKVSFTRANFTETQNGDGTFTYDLNDGAAAVSAAADGQFGLEVSNARDDAGNTVTATDTSPIDYYGVSYQYYDDISSRLTTEDPPTSDYMPDYDALTVSESGTADGVSKHVADEPLGPEDNGEKYAYRFFAYVYAPQNGTYEFFTESDDGSDLAIDEKYVVTANRGDHGNQTESGTVSLTEGWHELTVRFYENTGNDGIEITYDPPGGAKQDIPKNALVPRTAVAPPDSADGSGSSFPSDAVAFDDSNGDGQYDPNEQTYTTSQLKNTDLQNADLIIERNVTTDELDVAAAQFTVRSTVRTTNGQLKLTSKNSGDLIISGETIAETGQVQFTSAGRFDLSGATVNASNGIEITSNERIDAVGARITETGGNGVTIDASNDKGADINLTKATVRTNGAAEARLGRGKQTLTIEKVIIENNDGSAGTLVYDPNGVKLIGNETKGTVEKN
jgi:hypothetical protein